MVERTLKRPERISTESSGISSEDLKKKFEEMSKPRGGDSKPYIKPEFSDLFVPKEGENCIRIIPPLEIKELSYYGYEVFFHRIGPAKDYYLCLARMFGKTCAVCAKQTPQLWDDNFDKAKTYFPDHRFLMWIIDLKAEKEKEGIIQLWSCPVTLAQEIINQSREKGTDVYKDVSNPKEGYPIYFDRFGKRRDTKYKGVSLAKEKMPLPDGWQKEIVPFKEVLIIPTIEEVKAAIDNIDLDEQSLMSQEEGLTRDEGTVYEGEQNQPVTEERPECFGIEFGKYEDCDTACSFNTECFDAKKVAEKPAAPLRRADKKDADYREPDQLAGNNSVAKKLDEAIKRRSQEKEQTAAKPLQRIKR